MDKMTAAFFEFVFDRQAVWYKRTALGLPAPWTDDNILQNFRFCNVYRELDGGTIAIGKYLAQPLPAEQKLFNIIAYRFFNRRDTIENLFGGLLSEQNFDFKTLEKRFDAKKKEENIFSNAYLITAHAYNRNYRPQDKHVQILLMLNDLRFKLKDIIKTLRESAPQEGLQIIAEAVPIVGPGAHWGLNIICGRALNKKEADAECRKLWQMQPQAFAELKQTTDKDWNEVRWQNESYCGGKYLCLHDVQNSLCEFRKYWRLKQGENAKRRYFKPTN